MKIFKLIFALFITSYVANAANEPIYLIYADSLVGTNTMEQKFREFSGNVQLRQGDVNVKCDYAKQFIEENRAEMLGNVVITQKSLTLKAPKINYFGNEYTAYASEGVEITDNKTTLKAKEGIYQIKQAIANFRGDVVVIDDSVKINSDFITHHRKTNNSFAYGNVIVRGKYTNVIIIGDTIMNYSKDFHTIASGMPALFQIDSSLVDVDSMIQTSELVKVKRMKYDTLTITADTMEAFRVPGNERYVFRENVQIFRDDVSAKCNFANYLKDGEGMELRGDPIVWYQKTQLFGDSINIDIPDNKLKKLQALSNAFAVSMDDSLNFIRKNQLAGQEVEIVFENEKIDKINSYKDAKSLYFFADEEGNNGANRTTTDTIRFIFNGGELEDVLWLGVSYGENISENLVYRNEKSYYLPQYRWVENRLKKRFLKIDINK